MSCTNCFNGCEIVSDRCVKYTGIDIPELGIQTGDTLSHVEQSITTYLVSVLNGSGVKIDISSVTVCNTVQKYLPVCSACTDVSIVDIATALIKAACDLQGQIDNVVTDINTINNTLTELNSTYSKVCLTSPPAGTINVNDTHSVLQAVIDNFCSLAFSLPVTYVSFDNVDDIIQTYLTSTGSASLISNRMVPYAVVPYFGPLTNFSSSGEGLANTPSGENWSKIYLCNGNVAPDLRGFGLVGAIAGVPGGALNSRVNPASSVANPNYSLFDINGANQITLQDTQIPVHTHANTISVTDTGHTHGLNGNLLKFVDVGTGFTNLKTWGTSDAIGVATTNISQPGQANINATITNAPAPVGGGLPHPNIQPVVACYYIQYRP